jgi:xylose isomerase
MTDHPKISISMAGFRSGVDWVCPAYRDEYSFEGFLDVVVDVPAVTGIDLGFPPDALRKPDRVLQVGELVRSRGLRIACLMVNTYSDRKWKYGNFTAPDPVVRAEAIEIHKRLLDVAEVLEAEVAGIWLAHDGFDYILQVDYGRHWDMLVAAFREVMAHRPKVKAGIEYKLKDPRHFCHLANVGTCLMLIEEVGAPNLGVLQDVGHSLIARENMAESAVLAMRRGRLFHTHWNENYGSEDIDMMAGSVHVWETVECLYWLGRMGYDGWYGFDVISKREDPIRHINESVAAFRHMMDIAGRLDAEVLDRAQREQDAVTALQHLRETALR